MADTEKCTPEQALMNCLSEAERIDQIVIVVSTKDGFYEYWSNDLESHVRLGLLRHAELRIEEKIRTAEDI